MDDKMPWEDESLKSPETKRIESGTARMKRKKKTPPPPPEPPEGSPMDTDADELAEDMAERNRKIEHEVGGWSREGLPGDVSARDAGDAMAKRKKKKGE